MALLELLSGESSFIAIPIGSATRILLDPIPMLFTSREHGIAKPIARRRRRAG
jgi:hypothetical protein